MRHRQQRDDDDGGSSGGGGGSGSRNVRPRLTTTARAVQTVLKLQM